MEGPDHWRRRVARPWRVAFLVYATALTAATHWPALQLGAGGPPVPDKVLHVAGFGGLVFLLWRTRWLARSWAVVLLGLAWVAADEVSQAIPAIHRTVSWQDLVAGQLGVVLVGVWWWALRPIGGPANRARLAFSAFLMSDLFTRVEGWLKAGAGAAAGGLVVGAAAWLAMRWVPYWHTDPGTVLAAGIVGGIAGVHFAVLAMCRGRARELAGARPCFACGGPCGEAPFDGAGRGRCPACGGPIHRGQWIPPLELPTAMALQGVGRAVAASIGLMLAVAGLYFLVLVLSVNVTSAKLLVRAWQRLDVDMRLSVDAAVVGLAMAVGARLYRRRQARLYDRQHVACRCCGHDLSGTPVPEGVGVCPECSTSFAGCSDD